MKRNNRNKEIDSIIDGACAAIREQNVDAGESEKAAERVWQKMSASERSLGSQAPNVDQIRGCADFQALIPAYLAGTLSSARTLLLEDHSHECIPCRKALKLARNGDQPAYVPPERPPVTQLQHSWKTWKWAAAAAIAAGLVITALVSYDRLTGSFGPLHAVVYASDGPLYVIDKNGERQLRAGDSIVAGETLRAGRDNGATLRLADGSLVEMRARAELSLTKATGGTTIQLGRGDVIVQAAKQHSRHLYVSTNDCLVTVTGTIFSVDSGTRGSRIAVAQGQVDVDSRGKKQVVPAGQQISTTPALEPAPISHEFAWSHDAGKYLQLLADLSSLRDEVNAKVSTPPLRYSSSLLDLMPADTVLYVALPNISSALAESNSIVQERINQNPALKQWWQENRSNSGEMDSVVRQIAGLGQYLGDEIVIGAQMDPNGEPGSPVVAANVTDPTGLRSYLETQISSPSGKSLELIDDPANAALSGADSSGQGTIYIWIQGNIVGASTGLGPLQSLESALQNPAAGAFRASSFYSDVAAVYQNGAGVIVAADLEKIMHALVAKPEKAGAASGQEVFNQLGLLSLKHFIFETSQNNGGSMASAVLSFSEPRRGIASWLAAPGPMSSLEFVSPDANLVAAFVVRDPAALVTDLTGAIGKIDPGFSKTLDGLQNDSGVNIAQDLAGPLGGEYAFAIDGPLLPSPSWEMIIEVNDQAHLQQTLERIVERVNQMPGGQGQLELSDGNPYYTLKSPNGLEISYAYSSGYMIMAANSALIDRAIRYQASSYNLAHSQQFLSGIPVDSNANFSALLYHNLGATVGSLVKQLPGGLDALPAGPQGAIKKLTNEGPSIAYAYAEGDRITFSMPGDRGIFGLGAGTFLGVPGPFELQDILTRAVRPN